MNSWWSKSVWPRRGWRCDRSADGFSRTLQRLAALKPVRLLIHIKTRASGIGYSCATLVTVVISFFHEIYFIGKFVKDVKWIITLIIVLKSNIIQYHTQNATARKANVFNPLYVLYSMVMNLRTFKCRKYELYHYRGR